MVYETRLGRLVAKGQKAKKKKKSVNEVIRVVKATLSS